MIESFGSGRYRVVRELGRGGEKTVYLVEDLVLKRSAALALEQQQLGEAESKRLEREAQALAQMGAHPNIVTVYDLGQENGRPFIVSEYVAGGDLASMLEARGGPLELARVLAVARELSSALIAIHKRGIVHRDLKPSNVWIDESGVAKLGDFGLALSHDRSRLSVPGTLSGTPGYVAPEQLEGKELDGRADLYSLGCVLYELVSGRPPFIGALAAVLSQHLHAEPSSPKRFNPDVPEWLERLILSLLAKDPAARPNNAALVLEAIEGEGAAPVTPTAAATPPPPSPSPSPSLREGTPAKRMRPALIVLFVALALALAGGVVAFFLVHTPARAEPSRLAVIAAADPSSAINATVAWALSSRVIEEIDRYREIRPVSPAGILAARMQLLGATSKLPDESVATELARRLGADTIAALAISRGEGDTLNVSIHVYATSDPGRGVSTPREKLTREDLDHDGPARLGRRMIEAIGRHAHLEHLTDELGPVEAAPIRFDAYQFYSEAQQYCLAFRFDSCETWIRKSLALDPDNALYHSTLACALSYQGSRDVEAEAEIRRAAELSPRLTSRHQRTIVEQELLWLEAEHARGAGDQATMRALAEQSVEKDHQLIADGDPWGYLYEAATRQYFLHQVDAARALYESTRELAPDLYGPYYEEAKLLRGDGTDREGNARAGELLWTFIRCFPDSELIPAAKSDAERLGLKDPGLAKPCPHR